MFLKLVLLCSVFLSIACSKKEEAVEPIFKDEEFSALTSFLTQVNPVGENAIPYAEYSIHVNKVLCKTFIYERLRFFAIGYDTVEHARQDAKRLNQYYVKNYVLDLVEGEPVLEDMVLLKLHATNPNRIKQRTPKAHEEHGKGHADGHSEGHGEAAAHH